MADQNNAPEMPARIWIISEDHDASWSGSFRRFIASNLDHGPDYPMFIRADRAAPEGQVRGYTEIADIIDRNITDETVNGSHRLLLDGEWHEGPVVDWVHKTLTDIRDLLRKYAAITPPPAAARAEIERLTKELEHMTAVKDIHQRKRHEYFERAEKAEAERDEARAEHRFTLGLLDKAMAERDEARASLRHMEGFERCTCGPCAIHGSAMLADAERDMRKRAADLCDCACMDGIGDEIRAIGDAILALPLKHADREGGV